MAGRKGWSFFYLRAKAITCIFVSVESKNVEVNREQEDEPHGRVADGNDKLLNYCSDMTGLNLLYYSL